MQCPRCSYVTTAIETAPADKCPKCGIYYAKFGPTKIATVSEIKPPSTLKAWIFPAVIAGVVGFFAGREQLKYEMRQVIVKAFTPQTTVEPPAPKQPSAKSVEFSIKGITIGMPFSKVDSVLNLGNPHCTVAGCAWSNATYGNQPVVLVVTQLNDAVCGINVRFDKPKLTAIVYGLEEKYGTAQRGGVFGQGSYFWLQGRNRLEVSEMISGIVLIDTACIEEANKLTRAAEAIRE